MMKMRCLLMAWGLGLAAGCGGDPGAAPPILDGGGGGGGGGGGDGGLGSEAAPYVTASEPRDGAAAVYPFELYREGAATLRRKRIVVTFSAPMDTGVAVVPLDGPGGEQRAIPARWSEDARALELEIGPPDPSDGGSLPLAYEATYAIDLRALRGASGAPLDGAQPEMSEGRIVFTTAAKDVLIEHACGHTFEEPFAHVIATAAPEGAPVIGTPHKRYVIHLPGAGAPAGYVAQKVPQAGAAGDAYVYTLLTDAEIAATITDAVSGEDIAVQARPTPPVCDRIRHGRSFVLAEGRDYQVRLAAAGASTIEAIYERDLVVP